jgi:hypothetical protein
MPPEPELEADVVEDEDPERDIHVGWSRRAIKPRPGRRVVFGYAAVLR